MTDVKTVLVTGGAGYIGSTVVRALEDAGHRPVVLDDFSTGRRELIEGVEHVEGDIADEALVARILDAHDVYAVIHCAAKMSVEESVARPLFYYTENVTKTVALLDTLAAHGCDRVIFSSSGSIYEPDEDLTVDEFSRIAPKSPYSRTKAMVEQVLSDVCRSTYLRSVSLRYFNPIGADPGMRSGMQLPTSNLVVAALMRADHAEQPFVINGTGWPTRDGTPIRDYVHVWDVARAHVAAIERFDEVTEGSDHLAINLGTGEGTTVRELVDAYRNVTGHQLQVQEGPVRAGDNVGCYMRAGRAAELLGWRAELSLEDGIRDSLKWHEHRRDVLGIDVAAVSPAATGSEQPQG